MKNRIFKAVASAAGIVFATTLALSAQLAVASAGAATPQADADESAPNPSCSGDLVYSDRHGACILADEELCEGSGGFYSPSERWCICGSGKIFNNEQGTCGCPAGKTANSHGWCVSGDCPEGQEGFPQGCETPVQCPAGEEPNNHNRCVCSRQGDTVYERFGGECVPRVDCRETFGIGAADFPKYTAAGRCECDDNFMKNEAGDTCIPRNSNFELTEYRSSTGSPVPVSARVCPEGRHRLTVINGAEAPWYRYNRCSPPEGWGFVPYSASVIRCSGGSFQDSNFECSCPSGQEMRGREELQNPQRWTPIECVPAPPCPVEYVRGVNGNCRPITPADCVVVGQILGAGGVCEEPVACRSDQLRQSDNTCACPEGQIEFDGDTPSDADDFCAVAAICDSEQHLLPDNTCGCQVNYALNRLDGSGGIRTTAHNSVRPEFCARDMADICSNIMPGYVGKHIADPETDCLICEAPLVNIEGECGCPAGEEAVGGECVQICRSDQVRNSEGICACSEGQREFGGVCAELATCRSDQSLQSDNTCACSEGQREFGGVCAEPAACRSDQLRQSDNTCACPEGQIEFDGDTPSDADDFCAVAAICDSEQHLLPDNTCGCQVNYALNRLDGSGGIRTTEHNSVRPEFCARDMADICSNIMSGNVGIHIADPETDCLICESPLVISGGECVESCEEGYVAENGVCVQSCRTDQVRSSDDACVCPEGQREFGGVCAEPAACRSDQSLQSDNTCACPEGQHEVNGVRIGTLPYDKICAIPPECEGGEVSSDNICVCPEGRILDGGECRLPQNGIECRLVLPDAVYSDGVCGAVCPINQVVDSEFVCRDTVAADCADNEEFIPGEGSSGGTCVFKCRADQEYREVIDLCVCTNGMAEFNSGCEVPVACEGGAVSPDNTCVCPEKQKNVGGVCECSDSADRMVDGQCVPAVACSGGEVSAANVCVCPEKQKSVGGVCECSDSADRMVDGQCVPAVACSGGEVSAANVCVCPEKQKNVGGVCECSDSADRMVDGQCVPAVACSGGEVSAANVCVCPEKQKNVGGVCECSDSADQMVNGQCVRGGSSLTRDASKVEEEHQDLLEGATANLGFSPAGLAGGTAVESEHSDPSRLPEYAAPAALIGALAFSQLYSDYSIVPSFDFAGENEDVSWESGMTGEFSNGAFSSFISASHSSAGGFSLESGTAYRGGWFSGSYRALESRDEMDYELSVSSPLSLGLWELSPQAGAEFGYRRTDNEWHSDSSVGVLASWTAHRWKVSAQSNFAGHGRHGLDLELRF